MTATSGLGSNAWTEGPEETAPVHRRARGRHGLRQLDDDLVLRPSLGGVKRSGYGRDLGRSPAIKEFARHQDDLGGTDAA